MELEVNTGDCELMALAKRICSNNVFFRNTPPLKLAREIVDEIKLGNFMCTEEERIEYLNNAEALGI